MRSFFYSLSALFIISVGTAQNAQTKQPNIIFLLVDDMGYGECGFNGGKEMSTPNIDRLARAGAILENSYVQPVCSPTRATLLTGRYPTHTGIYTIVKPGAKSGLPLNERTLADALRSAGYRTAITGKWHLGEFDKAYQPNARGFDYQYGHFFGAIDYYTHQRNNQLDWYRNGEPVKEAGYSTHLITRDACQLIETVDRSRPLFLYIPFNGIHAPYQVPDTYLKPYSHLKGNRQILAGMLAAVDEAIGQIEASLIKAGLRENTLIIFSSDNGAPKPGDNTPLRDYKGSIYEGGIRGAAFANWPEHIPAGRRIAEPMHIVDWYPTLIRLAGGSLEQPLPIDGLDVWPMITKSAASPHDAILLVSSRGPKEAAIRMGKWKLIALGAGDIDGDMTPTQKSLEKYGPVALYNLADDPGETTNLASKYPETVVAMRNQLSTMLKGAVAGGGNETEE